MKIFDLMNLRKNIKHLSKLSDDSILKIKLF